VVHNTIVTSLNVIEQPLNVVMINLISIDNTVSVAILDFVLFLLYANLTLSYGFETLVSFLVSYIASLSWPYITGYHYT